MFNGRKQILPINNNDVKTLMPIRLFKIRRAIPIPKPTIPVVNGKIKDSPGWIKISKRNKAIKTSVRRIQPLISYFHKAPRSDKFGGTSLTGVQAYMGSGIPALTGSVVFSDLARRDESQTPAKGVLAYIRVRPDGKPNDFSVIETNDHFGSQSAYYVSMGTNLDQTRLYLGVHGSMRVTDFNQGTVFEIVP